MKNQKYINKYSNLTEKEVIEKQKDGKNVLPSSKKISIFHIFISEFNNPIIWIMIITAIFSFLVKEYIDVIAIVAIILIDAVLGTIQEYSALDSAKSLEKLIKVKARVIRDNKEIEVDSEELVVGDICLLTSGDKISADSVILECTNFTVDESVLTGESLSVNKVSNDIIYAGCNVLTGRSVVKVVNIGINTEIGKIATSVINAKNEKSPLLIRMEKFTKQISIITLIVAVLLIIVLLIKQVPFKDLFLSVVALTVSAIPEGLPLALTLALTIGSKRMLKKGVIIKKLNAVESLGSCTLIASDKTGTLTVNEQTAKKITFINEKDYLIDGSGYNIDDKINCSDADKNKLSEVLFLGKINNEAKIVIENDKVISTTGDTIDIAFLILDKKLAYNIDYKTIEMVPYESENRYSACFYERDNKNYVTVKGSLEKVLEFCSTMKVNKKEVKLDKEEILKENERLAKEGYRVIAICYGENKEIGKIDNNLCFEALVSFIDPIRKEVKSAIDNCYKAGVKVVMVTGDHPLTAFSIAKDLNIVKNYDEVTTGVEIDLLSDEDILEYVNKKRVFSRVTPLQKLRIVNAYKKNGEFVAVTGDGVNDAPAIKTANLGIAMGSGTDVSKEVSAMIIKDDNFLSIVNGIEEGRNAYNNIRKVIYLLLSCGFTEIFFFLLAIIFDLPIPLIAIQLLWLNLGANGLQDIALSFEKENDEVMNKKPRSPKEKLFDSLLLKEVLLAGTVIGIIVFLYFVYLNNYLRLPIVEVRTHVMILMVFMLNMHVLNCRNEEKSIFKMKIRTNPMAIFSILSSCILQVIIIEIPFFNKLFQTTGVDLYYFLICILLSLPILLVMELFKLIRRKKKIV